MTQRDAERMAPAVGRSSVSPYPRRLFVVLLVAIVIAATVYLMRPPPALVLPLDGATPVRGVLHVHSRISDGSGTAEEIAAAAARAGLQFVILTDHGDGTREPWPPRYIDGVLCIDAVEVTSSGGHVVALGLTSRTPYRLAGEPRDIVEDIRRLGGMSIAAHPSSPKEGLRWTDWSVPVDGIEWLNADSEWRDEGRRALARALVTYGVRPVETIGTLLDRPQEPLARWDDELQRRSMVAVAGADAHASIPFGGRGNPFGDGRLLPIPGYESVFRAFTLAVPDIQLGGDAAIDAAVLIEAIRAGRVYSVVDALASPPQFTFTAASSRGEATAGEFLALDGPVRIQVRTNAPPEAEVVLLRDAAAVARARGGALDHEAPAAPGVYRVEVRLPDGDAARVPWIVSNAIRVGVPTAKEPRPFVASARAAVYTDGPPAGGWTLEKNDASQGTLDIVPVAAGGSRMQMRFAVGTTGQEGPYVAFIIPSGRQIRAFERLTFRARADRPMRLWVQLRPTGENPDYTWRRSVYIGTEPRSVSVRFADMRPLQPSAPPNAPLDQVEKLMFVVDGVHTPPGVSGSFWIDDVAYER